MEISGFKSVPHAQLFGSATYLANPRDRNDTTSGSVNVSPPAVRRLATPIGRRTTPCRISSWCGSAARCRSAGPGSPRSVAWRVEGLPRYDLIGESHGFRRPGVEMFIEPGVSYAKGSHVYSFQMPIGYYRNRFPDPYTGAAGDATFPNYIFLASVRLSVRIEVRKVRHRNLPAMIRSHLSLAVMLAAALAGAPTMQDEDCDAAARPAKLNFALKNLEAASVKLSDFKGKVIVLNFWATWCVPCKAEIPDFVDLQARYGEQGLQLVGVAVDDKLAALTAYAAGAKMNYPVLQGRSQDGIMDAYTIEKLPMTVVIRRDGRVCRAHAGPIAKDVLEREIKSLM